MTIDNRRKYLMDDDTGKVLDRPASDDAREILLNLLSPEQATPANLSLVLSMADEYLRQYPNDREVRELRERFFSPDSAA